MRQRYSAIIVAGGTGSRAGGSLPKQLRLVAGRPMLWWSVKAFHDFDSDVNIVVVLHRDYIDKWRKLFEALPEEERIPHLIAVGGITRCESVRIGLAMLQQCCNEGLVAVHDAARPMLQPDMIEAGFDACESTGVGMVPVIPLTDSIRGLLPDGGSVAERRDRFVGVQTPQVFSISQLSAAYEAIDVADTAFTDDASVAEACGMRVALYPGSPENIKVTYPIDFIIARHCLKARRRQGCD